MIRSSIYLSLFATSYFLSRKHFTCCLMNYYVHMWVSRKRRTVNTDKGVHIHKSFRYKFPKKAQWQNGISIIQILDHFLPVFTAIFHPKLSLEQKMTWPTVPSTMVENDKMIQINLTLSYVCFMQFWNLQTGSKWRDFKLTKKVLELDTF